MIIPKALSEKVGYRKQRPQRIESLADGVFAITMTLLVLDIRLPVGELHAETNKLGLLSGLVPKILTFILSFTSAGLFWTVLTNHFNYIRTSDRNENIIAIFYLLFVSLLPFSTSFLSEYLTSRVAVGFYILNLLLILLIAILHWLYAYHTGLVKVEGGQEVVIHKAMMKRGRIVLIAYAVVAGCCFFSSRLALCGIIFLQFVFTFSGFIEIFQSTQKKKISGTKHQAPQGTHILPSCP
jgi:uncharacterized membrane protein